MPFAWELSPPPDGTYVNSVIPPTALEEFFRLVELTARRAEPEEIYFIFRAAFQKSVGVTPYRSSSLYFAPGDAKEAMERVVSNAPTFIAAFYGACSEAAERFGASCVPDLTVLNDLLEKHRIGYMVDPPNLRLREFGSPVVVAPSTLLERAHERFSNAIGRSEQLLNEGKGEEAVRQIWWLLESISNAFADLTINGRKITGGYFNDIIKSIQQAASGDTLGSVARWLLGLQGFLSGPDQGGIRHGSRLHVEGLQLHECSLLYNLTRSYISYLLCEYEQIISADN